MTERQTKRISIEGTEMKEKITIATPWRDQRWGWKTSIRTPEEVAYLLNTGVDRGLRIDAPTKMELMERAREIAGQIAEGTYCR